MENVKSSKTKRHWFHFSLKMLLLVVLLCAVACGWFVLKMNQANGRREAVAAIRKANGRVEYDYDRSKKREPPRPAWLVKLLGVDFFTDVHSVTLSRSADDQSMNHVKPLTNIRELSLRNTKVTDAGLEQLEGLTPLQKLDLNGTQITDAGLGHLSGLTGLQELSLANTLVTDAGLEHLQGLKNLERLSLANTALSGAGLKNLQGAENLEWLDLTNTHINDNSMEDLRFLWAWFKLTSLGEVSTLNPVFTLILDQTQITDAGLAHLEDLDYYPTALSLRETQVTDVGIEHLQGLSKLRYVELQGTKVTREGWTKLHNSLPSRWDFCPACHKFKALRGTDMKGVLECRFCGYKQPQ